MLSRRSIVLFSNVLLASCSLGQQGVGQQDPQLPTKIIDLHGVALSGLPYTGAFAVPFTCSSAGQVYIGEYSFDKEGRLLSPIPALYQIASATKFKQLKIPLPTGYEAVDRPSFFAGERTLVSLIGASQPVNQPNRTGRDSFLAVTDVDGDHPQLIRLNLDFDPVQVAVFGSGEFLVLGTEPTTYSPELALLNPEGQLVRYLDVVPAKNSKPRGVSSDDLAKDDSHTVREGSMAAFAPWGADVLMVLPGIDGSGVYHLRASGQSDRVSVQLPNHEEIQGVLGSNGQDTWVIRARSAASTKKMQESHLVENPEEFLYEISEQQNGLLVNRLLVHGPHPGEVACAADRKLTAIWIDWPQNAVAPRGILFAAESR